MNQLFSKLFHFQNLKCWFTKKSGLKFLNRFSLFPFSVTIFGKRREFEVDKAGNDGKRGLNIFHRIETRSTPHLKLNSADRIYFNPG